MARRLAEIQGVVVASAAYLAAHGEPRRIDERAAHMLLDHSEMTAPYALWRFHGRGGAVVPRGERRVRVNSLETMRDLAAAGAGLAVLPTFLAAPAIERGSLQVVLPQPRPLPHVLHAVFAAARPLAPKLRVLVDALVAHTRRPQADWGRAAAPG